VLISKAARPPRPSADAIDISEDAPLIAFDYELAADGRGANRRPVSPHCVLL